MSLDAMIMLAGALVATVPFLGFPGSWDAVLLVILGAIIVGLGITLRRRGGSKISSSKAERMPNTTPLSDVRPPHPQEGI